MARELGLVGGFVLVCIAVWEPWHSGGAPLKPREAVLFVQGDDWVPDMKLEALIWKGTLDIHF